MSFIAFLIAIFAAACAFMKGFAVAAANAIQLDFVPEQVKELISSIAVNAGLTLDSVAAVRFPEVVDASWLLIGAAVLGTLGGLFCFINKKFSICILCIAAAACGVAGLIADGKLSTAFIYAVLFALAAIVMLYKKTAPQKTKTSKSSSLSSSSASSSRKVNLKKGDKVNLTKTYPISKVVVGLGWKAGFDLDASAFLISANERVAQDADFVFYGNKVHYSGAVEHMGDNLTGSTGQVDDEEIKIDLKKIPSNINKIIFTVTIYDNDGNTQQNFGQVSKAFIRIFDEENSRELLRYELAEKFSRETGVICGELYRNGKEWNFNAIGNGIDGGLRALCIKYGVNV